MDGETLISLGTCASIEQLCSCGLKNVKQQLKLKRLIHDQSALVTTQPVSSTSVKVKEEKGRKLTRKELKCLPPEEKRVYLMM